MFFFPLLLVFLSPLLTLTAAFPSPPSVPIPAHLEVFSPSLTKHPNGPSRVLDTTPATTCTTGAPASKQDGGSGLWPIDDFTKILPVGNETHYAVNSEWAGKHSVGYKSIGVGHSMQEYAAFKCEYICNAADRCAAYFVQFDHEQTNCLLYNALITPELFVEDSNTDKIGGGGYDKLCK